MPLEHLDLIYPDLGDSVEISVCMAVVDNMLNRSDSSFCYLLNYKLYPKPIGKGIFFLMYWSTQVFTLDILVFGTYIKSFGFSKIS